MRHHVERQHAEQRRDGPDFMTAPQAIVQQNACADKLVDISDAVATYVSQISQTSKLWSTLFYKVTKKRSYFPCHHQARRHAVPSPGKPAGEGRPEIGGRAEDLERIRGFTIPKRRSMPGEAPSQCA
jgi:hypothetical protein